MVTHYPFGINVFTKQGTFSCISCTISSFLSFFLFFIIPQRFMYYLSLYILYEAFIITVKKGRTEKIAGTGSWVRSKNVF